MTFREGLDMSRAVCFLLLLGVMRPAVTGGEEDDAAPDPSTPWGEAVEGLQCRARTDNLRPRLGSEFTINYELRNVGDRELVVLRHYHNPHHVHIEWLDGQSPCWCKEKPPSLRGRIGLRAFKTLEPGGSHRGSFRSERLEARHDEAKNWEARFRIAYFVYPEVTRRYPEAWGPRPGVKSPLRVRSNVVEVTIEPCLPGEPYWVLGRRSGYTLEDAWVMADLVVRGWLTNDVSPRPFIRPGYREKDSLSLLRREGNRLRISSVLDGESDKKELAADYVTDPTYERRIESGEEVVAFLTKLTGTKDENWRLIRATRPADMAPDTLSGLRKLRPGAWGAPEKGLRCRLLGPGGPVSAKKSVQFKLHLRADAASADPKVKYLDRHGDTPEAVCVHFRNTQTGRTYTRREVLYRGPYLMPESDHRCPIRVEPLRPAAATISLVDGSREAIPPGGYKVWATYKRSPEQHDFERFPWQKEAWLGQISTGPIAIRVDQAKPFTEDYRVASELIIVKREPGSVSVGCHASRAKMIKIRRRPGYHVATRTRTFVHRGDKVVEHGFGIGGVGDLFHGLNRDPEDGKTVKIVVDVEVVEAAALDGHGMAFLSDAECEVLWKDRLEVTVPPAREVGAPTGSWGKAVNGLRSRLLLDRSRYAAKDAVVLWLDVRNDSGDPLNAIRGPILPKFLRLFGPDGREVRHIEDVWENETYLTQLEPGQVRSLFALDLREFYRLTVPGKYRVEWSGTDLAVLKAAGKDDGNLEKGLPAPPAPAVTFDLVTGTEE